ncbi:hypothetical protein AGABI1DRAFT_110440 [Agaricus bisporus var. burnettii JB137-S8]|nr:hypothetical protein AGABI2DRAFT_189661 [Agaricus bisporus var. bisporus H97]XP_007325638.1 uncharacterized protein AGABI1DRAFT_110440 [Agaricus bisporus var. burnettii JB137-S8]EKM83841.1 hypothetical protein AGABI1DRAFT_110440 [Agaricus bisporus var. burnettii JB137-S8]EKV51397.1 hypothetical protein AGABI2DRAFT_189661 [Agaricus bisporus var. bisporus H97]
MSTPLIHHDSLLSDPLTTAPSSSASSPCFRPPSSRSPSLPRPRRRSSQQRVSLIAGRVSIAPIEPPASPPMLTRSLKRAGSNSSLLSTSASTRAPSPSEERTFLGERSISEFLIEGEIGRGAYGLVKRGREIYADGSLGPPLVIKQVIKSRILADCWKKHSIHGTIPIEIYVMSAISNTSYVLPPRRPWDPCRPNTHSTPLIDAPSTSGEQYWAEGKTVKGHPNICPLLDFFEDSHYYYLILPSSTPEQRPNEPPVPSDLFDLVESFPQGLPARLIRTYLGQIADALAFLHSHGIVHRDVKDENVVLGPHGKCILIDFGSSGLVKKSGWDSFSGTLDYAGPEILRGERYYGKEQDVWAFGVVAYVLLVGECPFMTMAEAQEGLESPFANASIALDERCGEDKEKEGEEADGGGARGDAAALVRACLQVDVAARPTFERILQCRFLSGDPGWGLDES